jgi:hypothetical protein
MSWGLRFKIFLLAIAISAVLTAAYALIFFALKWWF